jgi:hypothetical protein
MQISAFAFQTFDYGVSYIFMSEFQMELNDYPHFNLAKDGRLCSTGQHCPGFSRVLYDALVRHGYDGEAPVYQCRLSTAHSMDQCEVSMMISWSGSVIGSEPNTGVQMMAHIALTSLCEDRLTTTAALPMALLLIQNQENPVWKQHLDVVRAVPVQPSAQHHQERHAAAYASDSIQGECHCHHW